MRIATPTAAWTRPSRRQPPCRARRVRGPRGPRCPRCPRYPRRRDRPPPAVGGRIPRADRDLGAGRHARLPVGDHALALRDAARDHRDLRRRPLHRHRPLLRRVRRVDHVHVRALLARHDRLGRQDEHAVLDEQAQRRRDELAGPERAAAVRERCLQHAPCAVVVSTALSIWRGRPSSRHRHPPAASATACFAAPRPRAASIGSRYPPPRPTSCRLPVSRSREGRSDARSSRRSGGSAGGSRPVRRNARGSGRT